MWELVAVDRGVYSVIVCEVAADCIKLRHFNYSATLLMHTTEEGTLSAF